MKKITVSILSIFILSALAFNATAQKIKSSLKIDYNYSLPLGNFKSDIISHGSPRGVSAELMFGICKNFSAGLQFGYQDYYQRYPRSIYATGGNHEVTFAVLSNSIQMVPLLAKGTFMPLSNAPMRPYISLGAGVSLINFSQYLGEFGGSNSNAAFTAQCGAGVNIPLGKTHAAGINIGADYNYVRYNQYGYNNLNNLSLKAGIYFPLK